MFLQNHKVRGEIRTTVEYLVQLLETKAFIENTIDTSWLDGILREKSVKVEVPGDLVVVSAAIYKAFQHVEEGMNEIMDSWEKGQVATSGIPGITSFDVEVPYQDTKYPFHVERIADDQYRLTLGSNTIEASVTKTAENALLANFGGESHRIFGMDEPLGLRLVVDGNTIMMPSIVDPSELRTDVTGKVVRYLKENGQEIKAGEPYVEVEAMKMIMTMKATETGKITNALSPGSVIAGGDLLASLELKDPSKVKKIETFDGKLDISSEALDIDVETAITNILNGYDGNPDGVIQQAFEGISDIESASKLAVDTLNEFLRVENLFAGKLLDDVVRDLTKANKDDLSVVVSEILAHQQLQRRSQLVLAVLRQVENFAFKYGERVPEDVLETVANLSSLTGKEYGQIVIAADMLAREAKISPFETRLQELRDQLLDPSTVFEDLAKSSTLSAGVDLLTTLFADDDVNVREAAAEVYVRRLYRAHRMNEVSVEEKDGRLNCKFSYKFAEVEESQNVLRTGMLTVIPSMSSLDSDFPKIIDDFSAAIGDKPTSVGGGPINMLFVASKDGEFGDISSVEKTVKSQDSKLKQLGTRVVSFCIPNNRKDPSYYTFPECNGYSEDPLRRDMRPTFYQLLELGPLADNFDLARRPAIGKNNQVYIGTEKSDKPIRGGPAQCVFVRGISHSQGLYTEAGAFRALQSGLDELELATADAAVKPQSSSRVFLHALHEIDDMKAEDLAGLFTKIMGKLKSQLAQRLLRLRVDEIEVKFRIASKGDDGKPITQTVRLVASSMGGVWLKPSAYVEYSDPLTGLPSEYCEVGEEAESCILDPYASSSIIQTKRSIARRVGSTYAYDFLGLMEVGLIDQWGKHITGLGGDAGLETPSDLFSSQELIEGDDGELYLGNREVGSNSHAMVAWLVNMKTPEYPDGRDVVVIANDVTVQSGSFGVEEDEFFYKASTYARERKLPRVYIACNAGARIGLVEDLKSKINIKFTDPSNPTKGFDYLYLSDADYKALPEGSVIAHQTDEGWAIDDVIGTVHGIGVENLQGSGKIAGETSRAYEEIFTLSYVTGRSVGIGAYLVRLGQRVIQKQQGPILLTGYSALNKLLGREVYTSQDQLGGPQIMVPNGVSHETVEDDQEGVAAILEWLSYVPESVGALQPGRKSADPVDRKVEFRPTPTPYDPREMMGGNQDLAGFFDKGTFKEYLAGWGKSVVIGRGRLGGIPMGAIAVETRLVDKVIPADPADPNSREAIQPQAGTVVSH